MLNRFPQHARPHRDKTLRSRHFEIAPPAAPGKPRRNSFQAGGVESSSQANLAGGHARKLPLSIEDSLMRYEVALLSKSRRHMFPSIQIFTIRDSDDQND